jgi:hypothetical protein
MWSQRENRVFGTHIHGLRATYLSCPILSSHSLEVTSLESTEPSGLNERGVCRLHMCLGECICSKWNDCVSFRVTSLCLSTNHLSIYAFLQSP